MYLIAIFEFFVGVSLALIGGYTLFSGGIAAGIVILVVALYLILDGLETGRSQ